MALRVGYPMANVIVAQDGTGDYNGTTEQCIQDAIDSLSSAGGWVFIKPGTYVISNTINVRDNYITLEGFYGSTILGVASDIVVLNMENYGSTIKNIIINGDGVGGGSNYAIRIISDYGELDTVEVYSTRGGGIYLNCSGGISDKCTVSEVDGIGMYITGSGTVITNFITDTCADEGVYIETADTIGLSSSLSSGCTVGVYVDDDVENFYVIDMFVVYNTVRGIEIKGSNGIISRCFVDGNTAEGIYLEGATYCDVSDNNIKYVSVTYPQTHGIREDANADYNILNDNIAIGNTTANYTVLGSHTITGVNGDW
jgi:parallel beta-helix repeat protein